MAESIAYAGSPFAQYLSDTGAEEELLQDHDAPSDAALQHPNISPRPTTPELAPSSPAPTSTSPRALFTRLGPKTANDHFSDRLKYSLATSALLNPRLSDAISLYSTPQSDVGQKIAAPSRSRRASVKKAKVADWGTGWDTRGQGLLERGLLGAAATAVQGVVGVVGKLVSPAVAKAVPLAVPSASDLSLAPPTVHTTVLATMDRLVSAAQELDLRTARALSGIRQVECVTWGLGLSDPLPPISRLEAQALSASPSLSASSSSVRPRVPSPLSFSPPSFPSSGDLTSPPPPLRALPLRQILSETLDATLQTLIGCQATLSSLTGHVSTTPTLSTLELSRHEAQAMQDRLDAEARERELEQLALEQEHAKELNRMSWSSEMSRTSTSDSTFGGIERKTSIRDRSKKGAAHRVRPSIGAVGVFGVGTAAESDTLSTPTRKPRRPASLGIWPGQSLSYALRDSTNEEAGTSPSAKRSRKPTKELEAELQQRKHNESLGLIALQDSFEEVHDARRVLLWRVMELVDRSVDEEGWVGVGGMLDRLATSLRQAASRVTRAVEDEFGSSGIGSQSLASARSDERNRALGLQNDSTTRSAHSHSPPPSRPLSLALSNASPKLIPTRASPGRPHPPAPSRPSQLLNYAPPQPTPSQAALVLLEQRHQSMSLSLRTISAKLHISTEDSRRFAESSAIDVQRLITTHDSIRSELDRMARDWEDSRVALRAVLKAATPFESSSNGSSSAEDEDAGSSSLESIADLEEGDSASLADTGLDLVSPGDEAGLDRPTPPQDPTERYQGPEQIFEAVVGQMSDAAAGPTPKPTREQRILARRAQEEGRERAAAGAGFKMEAGMVAELKDVLSGLKGRREQQSV